MYRLFLTALVIFIYVEGFIQGQGGYILSDNKDLILTTYSVEDGMTSNSIRKIGKLQNGALLIATYNGVSVFDGKIFTNYNTTNTAGLWSNNIYDFCQDKNKHVWLGTQNGVVKYDGVQFSVPEGLEPTVNFNVQSLDFDNKGVLWIGTTSNGLYTFYDRKLEKVSQLKELEKYIISLVFNDKENQTWIGTEQGHLYKYDGKKYSIVLDAEKDNGIFAACQDNQGNIYFGTRKGLYIYQNNTIKIISEKINSINDLSFDKEGRLWIASNSGLYYYLKSSNGFYSMLHNKLISSQITQNIYIDDEGIIWIGTYRKGLIKCRKGYFENFAFEAYGVDQIPSDVVELDVNNYLISTDEGEIYLLKNKEFKKINLPGLLKGSRIKSLFVDNENNIWVCSYDGLYKISPQLTLLNLPFPELSDNTIRSMVETDDGYFWIGTRQSGIHKMTKDLRIIKTIDTESNLSSNFVMSVIKGINGKIFVATKNGFDILLNDNIINHYDISNGLPDNLIFNIYEDSEGIIWIASTKGLSMIESGIVTNFNTGNGLVVNQVYDIVEDNFGFLWMPANNGIVRVKKADLKLFAHHKRKKITSFLLDESDGMEDDQYVSASKLLKTKDGRIVINTLSGLSILEPAVANFGQNAPLLIIKSIATEKKVHLINQENTELEAYSRYVQIDFSYIDFITQDKAEFTYKLEPFDSTWQKGGNSRFAKYTNLSPGEYKFTVKANVKSKGEKIIEQSIKFTIGHAFYETAFFKLGFIIFLIALVYTLYKIRVRSIKYQKAALENQVKERTEEINKQKEAIENHINELEFQKEEVAAKNEEIMLAQNTIEQAYLNLKLLSELGQQITSYLNEDDIITALYQEINSQMDCDLISIGNYNKAGQMINFTSTIFKGKKLDPVEGRVNDSNCILAQAMLNNSEIVTNNIQNDYPEYSKTFPELNSFKSITSLVVIPLIVKHELIGVFTVQSFRKDSYSEYHFNLIKNLAVYIGIAIENTKTFKEINSQKNELVNVNASKDRMFSIIGHDLRGPVGTIKSFLDLIIDNPEMADAESTLEILKKMQQSLGSAYTLLDNLLLWARNQRGQVEFQPRIFNLKNSIDEVFNLVMDSAKNKEISIISKAGYNDLVYADQNMITTVLRNLISNAVKFTPKGGKIKVITRKIEHTNGSDDEEFIEVKIIDNGVGITETDLEKILQVNELFSTPGTEREQGSGLGISICIDFLSRHNQKLLVENNVDLESPFEKGTTFGFKLKTKAPEDIN